MRFLLLAALAAPAAALDLNAPNTSLKLMGDFEGTTIMLKVKDARGSNAGVFKPTSGSTYHPAEFAAARLGARLGLDGVYPATRYRTIGRAALDRLAALLKKKTFKTPAGAERHAGHFEAKEKNRGEMLARLAGLESLDGVFKAWVSPLIFYYDLGTLENARAHPLLKTLRRGAPPPGDEELELEQCTEIFEPKGCYAARMRARDLAEQFTGMLLVDALIGNRDRFAGGNVHLSSRDGKLETLGPRRFRLPDPVLIALDNGAALQEGARRDGLDALRALGITRFKRAHVEALRELARDLSADHEATLEELGLSRRAPLLEANLKDVLDFLDAILREHGKEALF